MTYQSRHSYDAAAGVGTFDGSLVGSYIQNLQQMQPDYPLKIMPYSTQAIVYNLLTNSLYTVVHPPVKCTKSSCQSFLMSGGTMLTTPWIPPGYTDPDVVVVKNTMCRQFDFQKGNFAENAFEDADCELYSDNFTMIAMKFCVRRSSAGGNALAAGLFHQNL